jgi:outer membrane biosynthesis protein TonB
MPKSPRQVSKDVQEAVTEHVRDLPINAVRLAMFGVGRALLLSDRVTKDYKEIRESGVRPVLERWRDDAEQVAVKVIDRVVERVSGAQETEPEPRTPVARPPRKVNTSLAAEPEFTLGKPASSPGNVSKIAPEPVIEPDPEPAVIVVVEPASEPAPEPASESTAAAQPKPVGKDTQPEPVAADALPVPSYDELTLASVRARLRGLNVEQVSLLHDYERANAARADFIRMFVNRIAKLQQEC